MFVIMRGPFYIGEYVAKITNVRVSTDINNAQKFATAKAATAFLIEHDGKDHGVFKAGSKVVAVA